MHTHESILSEAEATVLWLAAWTGVAGAVVAVLRSALLVLATFQPYSAARVCKHRDEAGFDLRKV